jgi:hypothetical protein
VSGEPDAQSSERQPVRVHPGPQNANGQDRFSDLGRILEKGFEAPPITKEVQMPKKHPWQDAIRRFVKVAKEVVGLALLVLQFLKLLLDLL